MTLVLAGCSSSSPDDATSAEATASEEAVAGETSAEEAASEAEPLTIGVSFYSQQIPLFVEMLEGVGKVDSLCG